MKLGKTKEKAPEENKQPEVEIVEHINNINNNIVIQKNQLPNQIEVNYGKDQNEVDLEFKKQPTNALKKQTKRLQT